MFNEKSYKCSLDTLDKTSSELLERAVATYLKIMLEFDCIPAEKLVKGDNI